MRTIRSLGLAALALGCGFAAAQQQRTPVAGGTAAMPAVTRNHRLSSAAVMTHEIAPSTA